MLLSINKCPQKLTRICNRSAVAFDPA